MKLITIGEFAKTVGLTNKTLRAMHKRGELIPAHISQGGTRYYSTEQLEKYLHSNMTNNSVVIGYCRVSTLSQKNDLETQINNVKTYMYAKGYTFEIITDIGSGINYKKDGLKQLIDRIEEHTVSKIVILYKDRLVRFGYELIEYLCQRNGVEIEIIDKTEDTKEKELTDDLIQIITVFANRLYGARSKKTKQLIEDVKHNDIR